MKDLKQIVRRLKSRLTLEELYMYVVKDIYYKVFIQDVYYYHFNTANLKKVVEYAYNNYFISWDNIEDVSMNVIELLIDKYLFIFCDDDEPYWKNEYILLNNYYTKHSGLFNSIAERKPEFRNLIDDLTSVRLKDYIIDINFIYTILHPDSVIYKLVENESYERELDKLFDYVISSGIAKKVDSVVKEITCPIGLFNYPLYEEIYFNNTIIYLEITFNESDIQLLYDAYIEDFDILNDVYGLEQLTDSFVEDFD